MKLICDKALGDGYVPLDLILTLFPLRVLAPGGQVLAVLADQVLEALALLAPTAGNIVWPRQEHD